MGTKITGASSGSKLLGLLGSMILAPVIFALCTAGAWWPAHAQNVDTSIVKLPHNIFYKGFPERRNT